MQNFTQLGLPSELVESLEKMQITTPTPIQAAAIPVALEGHDLLASAQTGTGKTVAYSIPLILRLKANAQESALILTPTRELAVQVHRTLVQILGGRPLFDSVLLIGGEPMSKQFSGLRRRPRLIVGTPGRILDHLERGSLHLKGAKLLILDEADRMLDMGFGIQLDKIAEYLPDERQTLMFSATVAPNIERLSRRYLRDPKRISIGSTVQPVAHIKQEIQHLSSEQKYPELLKQLGQREGSVIVFVKTKRGADRLSRDLQDNEHQAETIHGDLPQNKRERVIRAFRGQKFRILVATDVAARGLDIPHVMHVINYNLPTCPEDYIHRIGRTGRAGAEGNALCLIGPEDKKAWRDISRLMGQPTGEPSSSSNGPRPPGKRPFRSNKRPFGNKKSKPSHFHKKKGADRRF